MSGSRLAPEPLWLDFLDGNFALVFLTKRELLLPLGSGICSSKISITNQVKKKVFLLIGVAGI